ncbi:MAG: hypothetical protein IPK83_19415 [Planctomycetes bacterium]|nr:hypothetical protein [Planctomycetota bacterium]
MTVKLLTSKKIAVLVESQYIPGEIKPIATVSEPGSGSALHVPPVGQQ